MPGLEIISADTIAATQRLLDKVANDQLPLLALKDDSYLEAEMEAMKREKAQDAAAKDSPARDSSANCLNANDFSAKDINANEISAKESNANEISAKDFNAIMPNTNEIKGKDNTFDAGSVDAGCVKAKKSPAVNVDAKNRAVKSGVSLQDKQVTDDGPRKPATRDKDFKKMKAEFEAMENDVPVLRFEDGVLVIKNATVKPSKNSDGLVSLDDNAGQGDGSMQNTDTDDDGPVVALGFGQVPHSRTYDLETLPIAAQSFGYGEDPECPTEQQLMIAGPLKETETSSPNPSDTKHSRKHYDLLNTCGHDTETRGGNSGGKS